MCYSISELHVRNDDDGSYGQRMLPDIVLFLLCGPKISHCPNKREIWYAPVKVAWGQITASPVANFTFIAAEMSEYSQQNVQNFEFWP